MLPQDFRSVGLPRAARRHFRVNLTIVIKGASIVGARFSSNHQALTQIRSRAEIVIIRTVSRLVPPSVFWKQWNRANPLRIDHEDVAKYQFLIRMNLLKDLGDIGVIPIRTILAEPKFPFLVRRGDVRPGRISGRILAQGRSCKFLFEKIGDCHALIRVAFCGGMIAVLTC